MGNYVSPILNLKLCSNMGSMCDFEGTGELHNEELPMSHSNATELSSTRKSFFIFRPHESILQWQKYTHIVKTKQIQGIQVVFQVRMILYVWPRFRNIGLFK